MQVGGICEAKAKYPGPGAVQGTDVAEAPILQARDFQSLLWKGEIDIML